MALWSGLGYTRYYLPTYVLSKMEEKIEKNPVSEVAQAAPEDKKNSPSKDSKEEKGAACEVSLSDLKVMPHSTQVNLKRKIEYL